MIKMKELLNEEAPGFKNRKFGDPLPTFKEVMETHQTVDKETIIEKAEFGGFDSQTLGQLKQRMKKASANYHNWSINADEFLWDVDTSTGDGKKLKKMIYDNRFTGSNSGKKISDLMSRIFKQAIKAERDSHD